MSLFDTGIRPAIDNYLLEESRKERDYGEYWSASSAGYCMRRNIFERLKVPHVEKESDGRKQRVFTAGHLFHAWIQGITKNAGLSIASEIELQDEDLMIRGHIDDLVLIKKVGGEVYTHPGHPDVPLIKNTEIVNHLILYDYKTQNSRAFTYQKGKPMSYFHRMQLGTYMYMLRKEMPKIDALAQKDFGDATRGQYVKEARILKISKDDLRMDENQLLWSPELELEITTYWKTLNKYWADKKLPPCTCADHEGGFLAKEAYNPYFLDGEPCNIKLYERFKEEQNAVK